MEIVLFLGKGKMFKTFLICVLFASTQILSEEIDLTAYEKSIYSQNGEDGIIAKIFQLIEPSSWSYVDLGAGDGKTGSSTYLLRLQGWTGLSLDRSYENRGDGLHKEFITAENINGLFEKYNVPIQFDLLCIDLDYNDFHIWNAIDKKYKPSCVLIGYNASHPPMDDKVVEYRPYFCGDMRNNYFGASLLALYRLARSKGYSLIYAENHGIHLFFIHDDVLQKTNLAFKNSNDVEKIYRAPIYGIVNGGRAPDPKNRPYLSSSDYLE